MRRVGLAVLLAAVVVPGAVWVLEARAAANCLDRGGSYNYSTGQCDFVTSHGRILFASRHGVLLVASAAALLLGISLFARGKGGAALLVIRAASERRALLFCLGVGLLAIALGIVSLAGSLPPSSVGIWGKRGHVFWLAALILSLDVVLVLGGGRGPRGVAIAARTLLLAFLVLLVGCGSLMALAMVLYADDVGVGALLQLLVAWGLMGTAQWYCVRAMIDRLSESV